VLRRAGRDDTAAVCELLGEVFPDNPKADPAILTWQYWDNPYGATSSWVAEEDGVVLGHYAAFPIPGRLAGRPALLAMGADAATRPAARGRGLFTQLAGAVWQGAADEGCRVVLAAPNPNSRNGAVRAGMVEVADLPVYVKPLDDGWLAERFRLPRTAARVGRALAFPSRSRLTGLVDLAGLGAVRGPGTSRAGAAVGQEVSLPPEGLEALWARTAAYTPWTVAADPGWWRWRYAERPRGRYRYFTARRAGALVGAAAATVRELYGGRFLLVLDLVADDGDAAAATLAPAVAEPRGAVGAALVAIPGSRLASLAAAAGFRRLPRRLEPRPLHFGVIPKDPALDGVSQQSWSVSWSLLDHL
jgi:GNAT superfamily N-acetyltransferase